MQLHTARAGDPRAALPTWVALEKSMPLGYVEGTRFPAGFGHLMGGYGAGYYGYLWSKVVAMDMRTAFAADKLDAQVGRRYRDTVLAQGSQRPPQQLVKDFLGRDFNAKAFFDELAR
jgi:thimet oligopeptidase